MIRSGETIRGRTIDHLVLTGHLEQAVTIERCKIGHLQLDGVEMDSDLHVRGSEVGRMRASRVNHIRGDLNLAGTRVGTLIWRNVRVDGGSKMSRLRLSRHTKFEKCHFGSLKAFGVIADDWVEFHGCHFDENLDLRSATVGEGMVFQSCHFGADCNLRGTTIEKKLDLTDSKLLGCLDLSKAKLRDYVYLQDISSGEESSFKWVNAIADFIHIEPQQLEGRLCNENDGCHHDAILEYGLLKRCYSTLHRYEHEDWAFYRFKVNARKTRPLSWRRPLSGLMRGMNYLFLDLGCGYGVQPWRALVFGAISILFFAMLYAVGIGHFASVHPPIADLPVDSVANRSLYGLLVSVSVFTAGFTGDHLISASGWVLVPLAIEAILGTVVWGLFIVAFSRKVIR